MSDRYPGMNTALPEVELARCNECGGSGTKPFWDHERELTDEESCPGCHGTGKATPDREGEA